MIELLRRPHGVIPAAVMPEIFTCSMVSTTEGAPAAVVKAAADRGFHPALYKQAVKLLKGEDDVRKDTRQALERCQEAANLGHGTARKNLSYFLNNYAVMLFKGGEGVRKDIHEAIKVCREAASLGNEAAKKNLAILLNNYAVMLFNEQGGIGMNSLKAMELWRESASLGDKDAKRNLSIIAAHRALPPLMMFYPCYPF